MTTWFEADRISVTSAEGGSGLIAGFAENSEAQTGRMLIFQRSEEDGLLGFDIRRIDGTGAVSYGCITEFAADGRELFLRLTPEGARQLNLPRRIRVPLKDDADQVHALHVVLQSILHGVRDTSARAVGRIRIRQREQHRSLVPKRQDMS